MTKPEPMLWLSDARGAFIPRDFVQSFGNLARVSNVPPDDLATLAKGPDEEYYWEAWQSVLDNAKVTDDNGQVFTVYQDGDCWLIPEGMEWDEDSEFFRWPD